MCSSDKQNMAEIENVVVNFFSWLYKNIKTELKNKGPEAKNDRTESEKRTKFIKELEEKIRDIKKQRGWECLDSTFIDLALTGLTVTGLTTDSVQSFGGTLDPNLTSLGVAVNHQSVITLPDCKDKLKKLKSHRMEGSLSGIEKLGEKLGKFTKLNDLTLANMDIGIIHNLPELLCLRLYGVCQGETCKIELEGCCKLKKLVIGDMGNVTTVKISSAVLETVVTLKFSDLPKLKEVAYTDKRHSLLKWANSTPQECSGEVKPNKTIFLRNSGDNFPDKKSPGLEIYKYDMDMQCYKLKPTQNN